jgi:hypothetical protein
MMEWVKPWREINRYEQGEATILERVIRRELAPGHRLYDVKVEAIGRHMACDDVLFALLDGSGQVAVVHLTWTRNPPETPPWPDTQVFQDLKTWAEEQMLSEQAEANS